MVRECEPLPRLYKLYNLHDARMYCDTLTPWNSKDQLNNNSRSCNQLLQFCCKIKVNNSIRNCVLLSNGRNTTIDSHLSNRTLWSSCNYVPYNFAIPFVTIWQSVNNCFMRRKKYGICPQSIYNHFSLVWIHFRAIISLRNGCTPSYILGVGC